MSNNINSMWFIDVFMVSTLIILYVTSLTTLHYTHKEKVGNAYLCQFIGNYSAIYNHDHEHHGYMQNCSVDLKYETMVSYHLPCNTIGCYGLFYENCVHDNVIYSTKTMCHNILFAHIAFGSMMAPIVLIVVLIIIQTIMVLYNQRVKKHCQSHNKNLNVFDNPLYGDHNNNKTMPSPYYTHEDDFDDGVVSTHSNLEKYPDFEELGYLDVESQSINSDEVY